MTLSFGGGDGFSVSGTKTNPDTLVGAFGISRISVAGLRFEW